MGYYICKKSILTYHHLIIPNCMGGPKTYWNGCVLIRDTSHDYLHEIEKNDYERFLLITSEMIDEKIKGKLDIENLRQIRDILLSYEQEHEVKQKYLVNRIKI